MNSAGVQHPTSRDGDGAARPSSTRGRLQKHIQAARPLTARSRARSPSPVKPTLGAPRPLSPHRAERPQAGAGGLPSTASDSVTRLVRESERQEPPCVPLLMQCLTHICELQFAAAGGDSLLWMVGPVLREARSQLLEANDERQALEAEVINLQNRLQELDLDLEARCAELRRAEESEADRAKQHHRERSVLKSLEAKLQKQLAKESAAIEDLRWQVEEGLEAKKQAWAKERLALLAEIEFSNRDIAKNKHYLDVELQAQIAYANRKRHAAEARFKEFEPDAVRTVELNRLILKREETIEALEGKLQDYEDRRAARNKKKAAGDGASSRSGGRGRKQTTAVAQRPQEIADVSADDLGAQPERESSYFAMFDLDGDGVVTGEEVRRKLSGMGPTLRLVSE